MDLLLLFLFIFKTLHTHLVCTSGYWKYVLKQNEQNVLFQAEIIVKNVLLKISKLHFSFFVVRVMSRKWAMMSWICIACWYLKVVVVKTLEVRPTYFCRHSGRPVTALLAQGDCCCSTGGAGDWEQSQGPGLNYDISFPGMWRDCGKNMPRHANFATVLFCLMKLHWSGSPGCCCEQAQECRLWGLRDTANNIILFISHLI